MKHIIIVTVFLVGFQFNNDAQVFERNKHYLSIGIGHKRILSNIYPYLISNPEIKYTYNDIISPYFLKYEYGVTDHFSIGLNASGFKYEKYKFRKNNISFSQPKSYIYSQISRIAFAGRINYHYPIKKFDLFIGAGAGLAFLSKKT